MAVTSNVAQPGRISTFAVAVPPPSAGGMVTVTVPVPDDTFAATVITPVLASTVNGPENCQESPGWKVRSAAMPSSNSPTRENAADSPDRMLIVLGHRTASVRFVCTWTQMGRGVSDGNVASRMKFRMTRLEIGAGSADETVTWPVAALTVRP